MQTKFNSYTEELNEIISILNNFPKIHYISSKELRKYQNLISRKEFLQKKINNMLSKRANIIGSYNDKNRVWLESSMNCRKYYRLEQSAAYSRDKALYRTGFLNAKPTSPFIQNFKNGILENFYQPLSDRISDLKIKINSNWKSISSKSPIYQGVKKSKKFIKNDLPISATNMAISGAKKCILSYRKLANSINGSLQSFSRNISSAPTVRTISYIVDKARQEADMQENPFMARIKVNPNTYEYSNDRVAQNGYYGTGRPAIQSTSREHVSFRGSGSTNPNFDLAL